MGEEKRKSGIWKWACENDDSLVLSYWLVSTMPALIWLFGVDLLQAHLWLPCWLVIQSEAAVLEYCAKSKDSWWTHQFSRICCQGFWVTHLKSFPEMRVLRWTLGVFFKLSPILCFLSYIVVVISVPFVSLLCTGRSEEVACSRRGSDQRKWEAPWWNSKGCRGQPGGLVGKNTLIAC